MTKRRRQNRVPQRGYARIYWAKKPGTGAAKLTVPAALARMIGTDILFKVELTDEGLLYRYVEGKPAHDNHLPAWLEAS